MTSTVAQQPAVLNQPLPKSQAEWQQIQNQLNSWQQMLISLGLSVPISQTPAETSAGSKVVNPQFVPLDIRRYGAVGDGALPNGATGLPSGTDDTPAFQAAINAAKVSGGQVFIPPPPSGGFYLLNSSVDCTLASGATYTGGIKVTMTPNLHVSLNSPMGSLYANHTSHVFDCAGNNAIQFEDVVVTTSQVNIPQTCFFLARTGNPGTSQINRFTRCRTYGMYSTAVYYNNGSEDDVLEHCAFFQYYAGGQSAVCVWTANNLFALTSPHVSISTGPQSSLDHMLVGGQFSNQGGNANADVFYLDQAGFFRIYGGWTSNGNGTSGGRSIILIDTTKAPSSNGTVIGLEVENQGGPQQKYGIYAGVGSNPSSPVDWTIRGCHLRSATQAIYAAPGVTIDSWDVGSIDTSPTAAGILIDGPSGTLTNSNFSIGPMPLTAAISSYNVLAGRPTGIIGQAANWNIGQRISDSWLDQRTAAQRQWQPNFSAGGTWTNASASSTNTGSDYNGVYWFFDLVIVPSGGALACTAGAMIILSSNAPQTIVGPGDATLYNQRTGLVLSQAIVNSTGIVVTTPLSGVTDNVVVTGRVRVA